MQIQVTDKWRIKSDDNQWIAQEYAGIDKVGKEIWQGRLFYGTFSAARKGLSQRLIREIDTDTLEDAIEAVEALYKHLDTVWGEGV